MGGTGPVRKRDGQDEDLRSQERDGRGASSTCTHPQSEQHIRIHAQRLKVVVTDLAKKKSGGHWSGHQGNPDWLAGVVAIPPGERAGFLELARTKAGELRGESERWQQRQCAHGSRTYDSHLCWQ
jgi:hypothetical protein